MEIGCVLMASGFGRRFGSNKLLLPVEGVPLVQRALTLYAGSPFARRVVVSQYESILSLGRKAGFLPLPNPEAARGISASVTLGTRACMDLDGILFGVCDQPWLTPESVNALLEAFQSHPDRICSLCYGERRGNPALFPSALFPELLALTGDTGGGQVIRRHKELLHLVPAAHPRELFDIDRPEDLPQT